MSELLTRIAISLLISVVVILAITLYAEHCEKAKVTKENKRLKANINEYRQEQKRLSEITDALLEERKQDQIRREIAKAVVNNSKRNVKNK